MQRALIFCVRKSENEVLEKQATLQLRASKLALLYNFAVFLVGLLLQKAPRSQQEPDY